MSVQAITWASKPRGDDKREECRLLFKHQLGEFFQCAICGFGMVAETPLFAETFTTIGDAAQTVIDDLEKKTGGGHV